MYKQTNILKYLVYNNLEKGNKKCNNLEKGNKKCINEDIMYIYTDGACSNNGKKGSRGGIGIYFGEGDNRNVSRRLNTKKQSNNMAELMAIREVYNIMKESIKNNNKIVIMTDSKYSILCLTSYGEKCNKKNWDVDIPNKELVRDTYELYKNTNVKFQYIKAHTNRNDIHSKGNWWADKLATDAIKF